MATISGGRQRQEPGSGGKIVRPRRPTLRNTPYDRPRLLNSTQKNPNWISRHIFPPARTIVAGASRMLSSVLGFDSSSSSSSSSDCDSTSDDADDNNDNQDVSSDVSSQGVHTIEPREPQSLAGNNESKRLIEQLLRQETFSREECDKLTNIINSRVADSPIIRSMGLGRLNEMSNKTGGSDVETQDLRSAAVMVARKFLEEKKWGSISKSEFHHGTYDLNSMLTNGVEGEAGSPVDMAKSYMRTRPPWESPSTKNTEFRSPSPIMMPLFKEETPYPIGVNSFSSSKRKKDSPATGSWNIQEELRKVRSKATEELLKTQSSFKVDMSSFALKHKNGPDSLVANSVGPAEADNPQHSKKLIHASADLAAEPVSLVTQDALENDDLPNPATLGCEQNQVMGAIQSIEGERASFLGSDETLDVQQRLQSTVDMKTTPHSNVVAADVDHSKDSNESILLISSFREGTLQDSKVEDRNCLNVKEVAGMGGAATTANGFPSSGSSMSAELDKEQNDRSINVEDNEVGFGQENASRFAAENNCELLSEDCIDVPMVNETDAVVSGSQHSSSMQYEGSPEQLNTPDSKRSLASKSNSGIEKQQGKKVSRYKRRGRGRGR